MKYKFKGLLVSENGMEFGSRVAMLSTDDLRENDVLIRVEYSSLNYKDALSAQGNKGVTRQYPHVPGIDAAGMVVKCKGGIYKEGQKVLVTGFDLGMNTWGGFGEYITVPLSWIVPLPDGLTLAEAMYFGTAGLTAGLSVQALLNADIDPKEGLVAVSGVSGGVGSLAASILLRLGYQVLGISGDINNEYLRSKLCLSSLISREDFKNLNNVKSLAKPYLIGGIDTVGGEILSGMLKATRYMGTVTCCGNVASASLETSIFPFILRGISLVGIDSVEVPMELRLKIWSLLAGHWKPESLNSIVEVIDLDQVSEKLNLMLKGSSHGRYILKHNHKSP